MSKAPRNYYAFIILNQIVGEISFVLTHLPIHIHLESSVKMEGCL